MSELEKATLNKAVFYAKHIKKWQQSGISQQKYCKSVNISYPAFVYWHAKFSKGKKSSIEAKKKFLPLKPISSEPNIQDLTSKIQNRQITVLLSNGIQLLFPLAISSIVLVDCIKIIEGAYAKPGF